MEKALLVRLPNDLHAQLSKNRRQTGTSAAEYIRRAVRLALFADDQAAQYEPEFGPNGARDNTRAESIDQKFKNFMDVLRAKRDTKRYALKQETR
jgi:Arc/MetJ-type ribon-helix-helix transcriptional regulator